MINLHTCTHPTLLSMLLCLNYLWMLFCFAFYFRAKWLTNCASQRFTSILAWWSVSWSSAVLMRNPHFSPMLIQILWVKLYFFFCVVRCVLYLLHTECQNLFFYYKSEDIFGKWGYFYWSSQLQILVWLSNIPMKCPHKERSTKMCKHVSVCCGLRRVCKSTSHIRNRDLTRCLEISCLFSFNLCGLFFFAHSHNFPSESLPWIHSRISLHHYILVVH